MKEFDIIKTEKDWIETVKVVKKKKTTKEKQK